MQSNPAPGTRRLADNIISLYVLQGLNYLVPLAILPYLVRVLGMRGYGILAFAQPLVASGRFTLPPLVFDGFLKHFLHQRTEVGRPKLDFFHHRFRAFRGDQSG